MILNKLIIFTAILFVFWTGSVSAGTLLTPDELNGGSDGNGTHNIARAITVLILYLMLYFIVFPIRRFIVRRAEERDASEENDKNLKKLFEKLSNNIETKNVLERIRGYNTLSILNADATYSFYSLSEAKEKELEINNKGESIAFISKSIHYNDTVSSAIYSVLEFKK